MGSMEEFTPAETESVGSSTLPNRESSTGDERSPPLLLEKPELSPITVDEFELFCCDVQPITEIPEEWLTPELRSQYKELLSYCDITKSPKEERPVVDSRDRLLKVLADPKAAVKTEVEKITELLRKDPELTDDIDCTDMNLTALVHFHPQLAKEIIVSKIARDYAAAELLCYALAEMEIEVQTVETIFAVAVRCSDMGQPIPSDLLAIWINRNIAACEAVIEDPYRASRLVRLFCGLIIGLLTCKNPVTKELFDRAAELKVFSVKFCGFKEAGNMYQKLSTMMGHRLP